MNYIVFFIVLAIACSLIPRVPFIKNSGLSSRLIILLFLFKICAGVAQAFINFRFAPLGDTWILNSHSTMEYQLLLSDPGTFFKELFVSNYNGEGYDNVFGSYGSFWNDLEQNLLAKGLAPLNAISRGNYYINSIFYNFFGFFGHIALFRVFHHIFPEQRNTILLGCFGIPTMLFFTSAMGKDNVAFTAMSLFCFALYFYSLAGFNAKRLLWLIFCFTILLLMRNHIALLMIPPALAFYLCRLKNWRPLPVFGLTAVILLIFLLGIQWLAPALSPAAILSQKQADFLAIGQANSQVELTPLLPSSEGLIKNLPEAVNHGFFRPYLWEAKNVFGFLQGMELTIIILLVCGGILKSISNQPGRKWHAFVFFGLFFTCLVLVVNGYIVPNTNSLVRYRSIYLPLVIIPSICVLFQPKRGKYYI